MSSVVVIQTYDRLWIGADSAISGTVDGNIYRLHELGQKLFIVDDMVIFCSGTMRLAYKVMQEFMELPVRSLDILQKLATDSLRDYLIQHPDQNSDDKFHLGIMIGRIEDGRTVVYSIAAEDGYQLKVRVLNDVMDFAVWTGGIRCNEANQKAFSTFTSTLNIVDTYQQTFDHTSYEGIGGHLTVYQMDNEGINEIMRTPIKEKLTMKRLHVPVDDIFVGGKKIEQHLVMAETVIGQLGSFVTMEIGKDNDITKINTNGISAGHAEYNSAPFRVDMKGNVIARSIKLTGQIDDSVMNASEINAGTIRGSRIEGASIIGGSITSGTDINVTRDVRVGNNIILGGTNELVAKSVDFTGAGAVYSDYLLKRMHMYGRNGILLDGGSRSAYVGSFDEHNRIATASEINALQQQISDLRAMLGNKADKGHTHKLTLQSHNHGNPQNQNAGGGTFEVV
ncbi:hypothetical protein [Paenibacillus taiwanensis]|uniref:hypothetical protein n=1 Tax=Paenibacillus taiwanensis TaxID=401638 RepID=UPI00041507F0|nr:hypothetical protein [Paenibacillus taiwanensis]